MASDVETKINDGSPVRDDGRGLKLAIAPGINEVVKDRPSEMTGVD